MSCTCVCLNMEIQDLKPVELHTLGIILNYSNSWKKLMAIVPAEGNGFKFNNQHISIIEQAAETDDRNAAEIFIEEWSTMTKKAPTLELLLNLLIKAELFRAADYVACDILKQEKPKRPNNGPAAPININDSLINKLLEEQQILQRNINGSTEDLMLESELVFNQEMCPSQMCDKMDNDSNKTSSVNLLEIIDNFSNCKKSTNNDVSDLMKFSTLDTCDTANNHVEHTVTSTCSDSAEIQQSNLVTEIQNLPAGAANYEYKEVSSQELPVFLNNSKFYSKQFVYNNNNNNNETFNSSDIPLCLKDLSLQ